MPSTLVPSASDEFDGTSWAPAGPGSARTPRHRSPAGCCAGRPRPPTWSAPGTTPASCCATPPSGDWTVETKLTIDLGEDTVRNYQQAGLVVYVGDDLFTRLSHVAIWNTRQTEFGKEMPYAGGLSFGGTIVGPPADTTYLRITHRVDPANGEHELRGWTSRDGHTWVKGGVWTLPRRTDLRVGLVSHGAARRIRGDAQFDWFRTYR